MGNNLAQNTHKSRFEEYIPIRPLSEGRSLMQHKMSQKMVTLV